MEGNFFGLSRSTWSIIGEATIIFLVMLWDYANWASQAFGKAKPERLPGLVPPWRRVSTLVMILAFGCTVYLRFAFGRDRVVLGAGLVIIFALILRVWERDALTGDTDIDESDVQAAHDEVSGKDPGPKEKHWYDDVND